MWKHLQSEWTEISAKRAKTKQTAWLQTPDYRQTQTTIDFTIGDTISILNFLIPESPSSERIFSRIVRTTHSYSQAWRTLAIISELDIHLLFFVLMDVVSSLKNGARRPWIVGCPNYLLIPFTDTLHLGDVATRFSNLMNRYWLRIK
jgi:hypothetical protein